MMRSPFLVAGLRAGNAEFLSAAAMSLPSPSPSHLHIFIAIYIATGETPKYHPEQHGCVVRTSID